MIDADATLPDYEYRGQKHVNEVPVVCANIYQNGARLSNTLDYVIVEKTASNSQGGEVKVKIGVIGLADDYGGAIIPSQFSAKGYSIKVDYAMVNNMAAELESTNQVDATILLIHGAADTAAEKLGENSVVDLVLGGHTHVNLSGQTSWGATLSAGRELW